MKEMNLSDFKGILNYLLDNNSRLEDEGKAPIAIGLEADAGIGKTSIVEQVARERGMDYVKLNLSQLEEVGDLTGFPIKEFLVERENKREWIVEPLINFYMSEGWKLKGNTRLSYAQPVWLPENVSENGCILNLDDYSRAPQIFMQATMELINTGKYISWSLPKHTTVVLTSNPDNGDYNVSSLDSAQKTRFLNFNVKFDLDAWALWAEKYNLDSRAINFALAYPEIFTMKSAEGGQVANARSFTMFCNAISSIPNWENTGNLATILNISKGSFNDQNNEVGKMFTTFIKRKLDKLIDPETILFGEDWEKVEKAIKACTYKDKEFQSPIASILSLRLLNRCRVYFDNKGDAKKIEKRLESIISSSEKLFSEDMIFFFVKTIVAEYPRQTERFITNKVFRSKMI